MSIKMMIPRKAVQAYHEMSHGAGLTESEFELALNNMAFYLRNKRKPCKPSTIENKSGYIRTLHKKYGFEFTPEYVDRIRQEMLKDGVTNNSIVMILNAVDDLFRGNKVDIPVNKPRMIETVKDVLTEAQVLEIINAATFCRDKALLATLYFGAVRTIELRHLLITDVDFNKGYLYIRQEGGLKTGKGRRVSVPPICLSYIKEWLAFRRQFSTDEECPHLFVSRTDGEPLSHTRIGYIVKYYADMAGYHISPHGFRRAWATHHANVENMPISYVQHHLGHSSLSSTQKYVCTDDEDVKEWLTKRYKNL